MKGKCPLFEKHFNTIFKLNDLQLFAIKHVSDKGIAIQNSVSNQKLKNIIGELYREGAKVGDGNAMAAASIQVKEGILVGGKNHILKVSERITNLKNIIKTQNLDTSDMKVATKLLDDMSKSLKGEY